MVNAVVILATNIFINLFVHYSIVMNSLYIVLFCVCVEGNRCILSAHLKLDGTSVNDSHAEIIARRAFVRLVFVLAIYQWWYNKNVTA